jgi:predicted ATPase
LRSCCSAASKLDQAAAYRLKVLIQTVKSENVQAVASALACLRLFGIDLPAHPTWEQVEAEYETVWQILDGRPTESLIDLPMMTDPEMQASVQMPAVLSPPAYFSDFHAFCLVACRTVKIGMQHGISDASTLGFALLGFISGPVFHRYGEGYQFAKLACDLAEKHVSSPTSRRSTTRQGPYPSGRSRAAPRSISCERPFAPRLRLVI